MPSSRDCDNPARVSVETIVIHHRFRGPPESGNGGYACGLIAKTLGGGPGIAEVTLRAPPPLDAPLEVERDGASVRVRHGETLVAEGRPSTLNDFEPPPPPSVPTAQAARKGFRGFIDHPFPTCFVCGPDREEGDGLRIHPGWVPGDTPQVADTFVPDASLDAGDGRMATEHVWAALDCPGAFALMGDGREDMVLVLGCMAARIDERPEIGQTLIVTGWARWREGRKHACGTALFDASGRLLAGGHALWIALAK